MSEMGQGLELEWLVLGLASGPGLGLVVEPEPHPSEDGPLPAERIRRSWEAGKRAAMGPVVGLGLVVWPGRVVEPEPHRSEDRPLQGEPDPGAGRVWGRAGSGSRRWP